MKNNLKIYSLILFLASSLYSTAQLKRPLSEDNYYQIKTLPIPEGIELEVGGVATMPDGRVGISTRRGEIWVIENPYMKGSTMPHYTRFASGMHEVLGLAYKEGSFYCTQRGELTKLTDIDGDGEADSYEALARWPISGNYHEYTYGPVFDNAGDMYIMLNLSWIGFGEGNLAKWRGWMLKVHAKDGTIEPIATGLRSPAGFNLNDVGDMFYAENQGDWVGSGRITHLVKGDFAGNPGGLFWNKEPNSPLTLLAKDVPDTGEPMYEAAKKVKELKLPAVWFPHALMGISTADMLQDVSNGAFGPFSGQYFVLDQGQSKVMRMFLEKVNGQYQGACFPFRDGFQSGTLRARWGIDNSMFVGMTSRGWGSTGKDKFGLQRLEWTGETPFEMKTIKAMPDGFEIEFTEPVNKIKAENLASYSLKSFTYKYHHNYGSPMINNEDLPLKGVIVSSDGLKARLVLDNLRKGYIHQITAYGITNLKGDSLLHDFGFYTLNNIPEGQFAILPKTTKNTKLDVKQPLKTPIKPAVGIKSTSVIDNNKAQALLKQHTCVACHAVDRKVIGPSYRDIAKRGYSAERILELVYKPEPGNWPEYATEMAPMSHIPKGDVLKIAGWINSLNKKVKVSETDKLLNRD